ncbi:UvrD-helicase domain-containing protein [uncultured Acinetobacter sp.]|uniref:UvrD-helicase domain-containing protein n=1 Tax=uncultured Acinetobacter sp. TaxID=165433 RepID=UPI00262B7314|nr:UvrD-helicase domain-containing protein [uncultured Acinetobacter sp.]
MNSFCQIEPSYAPIVDMQFRGLHWIEASAGTGKTYTLSSLMVRVLLHDYLPHQVIATTFTRAAAAELKTRIRKRLQDTLHFLQPYQALSSTEILAQAQLEQDVLFQKILHDYADKIGYACERLKLVLDQFDELFVGTLDSFSQKLLTEFSFESGRIEHVAISDQAKQYTQQIIHDVLREWIQLQPQANIDFLLLKGILKAPLAYVDVVQKSLDFASAKMQTVKPQPLDTEVLSACLNQLASFTVEDLQELQAYYAGEFTSNFSAHVLEKPGKNLLQTFTVILPNLINTLKQNEPLTVFFNPQFQKQLKQIFNLFLDSKGLPRKSLFNKPSKTCSAEDQVAFLQHRVIQKLQELLLATQQFEQQLGAIDTQLKYFLTQEVKRRLPQRLQQQGETTFTQQMRSLSDALMGEQGQRFAQYVQSRYPLILVDEFQDTNQDQDNMLAQIWRNPKWYSQGCMIMVGDPKQAIYGFRGGDMLTYSKARQDVLAKHGKLYSLKYNQRSVPELVQVVDALFQQQTNFGEQVIYSPVEAGLRPHPICYEQGIANPKPLRFITLEDADQEPLQVAWQIRHLLNLSAQQQLYFQHKEQQQPLQADDIAVLSRNHDGLDKVQYELNRLNIRVNRASKRSVFDSSIAQDVGAILTAILHPFDEAKVKRALLSHLIGLQLNDLIAMQGQPEGLSRYMNDFEHIREMWLAKGFLTAWQYTLNIFAVWENLVRYQSRDNERLVVNLRHLTESLTQHSESYQGAQTLYTWYLKQIQSPGQRDWEMERSLSNTAGVQLMTVHQSKGLEFKIVFLLGASSAGREINKTLNFSTQVINHSETGQTEIQRVVAINDKHLLDTQAIAEHDARLEAEQHRLWYVALTRASHRVYAMLSKKLLDKAHGVLFWKNVGEGFCHAHCQDEPLLAECPIWIRPPQQIQTPVLHALDLPKQRFYPRSKTSFSALAQHLSRKQAMDVLAAQHEQHNNAADEIHVVADSHPSEQSLSWIKRNFPMGTLAGNFLHEIFEHIDFQDQSDWGLELHRRFKNSYPSLWKELKEKYVAEFELVNDEHLYAMLGEWLAEILNTPLFADFCLSQLSADAHIAEFPFYLALADRIFGVQRISDLFQEYGIHMLPLNHANSARYLTGSIDLVFYDGQRYHIADYKSNFLGQNQVDYSNAHIQANMSQASYWLQAGLYLVALHRYLSVQLQDYDIHTHLGGASYLYLRGMNGQTEQGLYYFKPEDEFILRLDALLGRMQGDTL